VNKIKGWLKTLFTEEFEVVIWYDPADKTTYHFKKINKVTNTTISAIKTDGQKFDLQVNEPFNYQITKVH
jgi:hypothetical protein